VCTAAVPCPSRRAPTVAPYDRGGQEVHMHAHRRIQRSSVALAAIAILWTAAPARASHIPLGIATPAHQDLRSPDARDIAEGGPSPADIVTLVRLVPDHRARPPQA